MRHEPKMKTCKNGHAFLKSSDCPVCPVCEKQRQNAADSFHPLSAPAQRALLSAGIQSVGQLAEFSESELLALHGLGPSSIPKLRLLLMEVGLKFKNE